MFRPDDQVRLFGVTPVENLFITEYLPSADGDKVKVYLCGLYHSQAQDPGFGVKEMAAELGLEEGQVLSALRYWERRRLVERTEMIRPTFSIAGHRMLTGQDEMSGDRAFIEFSEAVYAQFGGRRKLRPGDISLAYEWIQDLGLPQEVVLMLLNYAADTRGAHFAFRSMQPLAVLMREEGITSTEQAEQFLSHSKRTHQGARAVLAQFNLRRLPTEPELALYRKWTEEWRFDDKAVLAACAETVSANNPSFSYLNGILERLKNKGAGTKPLEVEKQLRREEDAGVKQVLEALGIFSVSAYSVLPAWLDLKGRFPPGMILLAAKAVRARGGTFEDLEPKLLGWAGQGIRDEETLLQHLRALKAHEPLMFRVFEKAGQDGRPGEQDLLRLKEWLRDGHSEEMILEAAAQARSSRQKLAYMDRVLQAWKEKGIREPGQARTWAGTPDKPRKRVGFQQYDQENRFSQDGDLGLDVLKEAREIHGQ